MPPGSDEEKTAPDSDAGIAFEFRGDGRSYFRIWVVNLFLSVITLGIYSAWAKVRSTRYFYSHLFVDNTCFEYLANPLNILLGRAIAATLFLAYYLTPRYKPEWGPWLIPVVIVVVPWIICKSLQFRAHNSAWRNIRFRFHGGYLRALLVMGVYPFMLLAITGVSFLALPNAMAEAAAPFPFVPKAFVVVGPIMLMILCPIVMHAYYDYIVANSSYGDAHMQFRTRILSYAGFLGRLSLHAVGAMMLIGGLIAAVTQVGTLLGPELGFSFAVYGGALATLAAYVVVISSYVAGTTNLLYEGIDVPGGVTFSSRVTLSELFSLYLVNTILIVITLGLYIPFAKIRMVRYRVSALDLHTDGTLDQFGVDDTKSVNAIGQEMGDLFDIGISL